MLPRSLTKSEGAGGRAETLGRTAPFLREGVSQAHRRHPRTVRMPVAPVEEDADDARGALHERFADRMAVRDDLSRRIVSYQANKTAPGLRWFKYKEGFSAELVRDALHGADGPVLDPFAGIGTSALVAAGSGRRATGVEIMPVGARAAAAISWVARQKSPDAIKRAGKRLLCALDGGVEPAAEQRFVHVPITRQAFSPETEDAIGRARAFLGRMRDHGLRLVLDVACMSVLEEASFTRKDGQYLRWDNRCGRDLRGGMNKGRIPSYREALARRLHESSKTMRRWQPATAAWRRASSKVRRSPSCRSSPTIRWG